MVENIKGTSETKYRDTNSRNSHPLKYQTGQYVLLIPNKPLADHNRQCYTTIDVLCIRFLYEKKVGWVRYLTGQEQDEKGRVDIS
jgi:hypothetical protein